MMRRIGAPLLLTLIIMAGTWVVGWWAVPVLAACWQVLRPEGVPLQAGRCAFSAWGLLLLLLPLAPLGRLAGRLAGVFQLPVPMTWLLAPFFAALLAWSAARLTAAFLRPGQSGQRRAVRVPSSQR
jgi:hypothetical protein